MPPTAEQLARVHRDGRLTMDHNGGALPPSGSSAGGVPNGLAGELPHVMDAVAFATQALENLQGRLERTLRAKDAEMLSVQGRLDKAFESCRAEIEVVASTTSEDLVTWKSTLGVQKVGSGQLKAISKGWGRSGAYPARGVLSEGVYTEEAERAAQARARWAGQHS